MQAEVRERPSGLFEEVVTDILPKCRRKPRQGSAVLKCRSLRRAFFEAPSFAKAVMSNTRHGGPTITLANMQNQSRLKARAPRGDFTQPGGPPSDPRP